MWVVEAQSREQNEGVWTRASSSVSLYFCQEVHCFVVTARGAEHVSSYISFLTSFSHSLAAHTKGSNTGYQCMPEWFSAESCANAHRHSHKSVHIQNYWCNRSVLRIAATGFHKTDWLEVCFLAVLVWLLSALACQVTAFILLPCAGCCITLPVRRLRALTPDTLSHNTHTHTRLQPPHSFQPTQGSGIDRH